MKKISEGKKGVANFFSCCLRGPLMLLFSHYTGAPNVNVVELSGGFFLAEIFEKASFDSDNFGSLDFQLGNPNR